MISDEKFEKAKQFLYLKDTYSLLHETTKDKINSILLNGLDLKKSYNGEITRVVTIPKNEDDFKNYNYYYDKSQKNILVIGVPKILLENIPINSTYAYLILNCIAEFKKPEQHYNDANFEFHQLKYQKFESTIPTKWITGYFDEDSNFFPNPNYIMAQENSDKLILSAKKDLLNEFNKRYPSIYSKLLRNYKENTSNVTTNKPNSFNSDYER